MAITVTASGTQSATVGTEHTLNDNTSPNGSFQLVVDCSNLANGDVVELRMYTKVLSGSSLNLTELASYANAQGIPNKVSIPLAANQELKCTLKQTAGTGRNFDWAVLQIDT